VNPTSPHTNLRLPSSDVQSLAAWWPTHEDDRRRIAPKLHSRQPYPPMSRDEQRAVRDEMRAAYAEERARKAERAAHKAELAKAREAEAERINLAKAEAAAAKAMRRLLLGTVRGGM